MKTEPRFSRYRVAIRSLNNKPILQSLAPLINLDTNAETDTIKQALITKYPMNALIIICKPKKTAGIQALCAPADLATFTPTELPTDFPILLINAVYEFNDIGENWTRISYSSQTNTIDILSLHREDKVTMPPQTPSPASDAKLPESDFKTNLDLIP